MICLVLLCFIFISMSEPKGFCERKTVRQAVVESEAATREELAKLQSHIRDTGASAFAPNDSDSQGSEEKVVTTRRYIRHVPKGDSAIALLELIADLQLDARKDMDNLADLRQNYEKSVADARILKFDLNNKNIDIQKLNEVIHTLKEEKKILRKTEWDSRVRMWLVQFLLLCTVITNVYTFLRLWFRY